MGDGKKVDIFNMNKIKQSKLPLFSTKWTTNVKKLDEISSESTVYTSFENNSEYIVKIPKQLNYDTDIIREYFIGIELNKLNNFVKTLDAVCCPVKGKKYKTTFVVYEKIRGKTIQEMFDHLDFSDFLKIFVQLLLTLEKAQRKINFCHFDLHTKNVMIEPKNIKTKTIIDNNIYSVCCQYNPIILDFGLSSIKYNDQTIGSKHFPQYGMMNYMIQGVDMYKFLVYSCKFSSGKLKKNICGLFNFYGKHDPYKFTHTEDFNRAIKQYVKKGSFSKIATYTPLDFVKWIHQKYPDILNIKERDVVTITKPFLKLNFNLSLVNSYIMTTYYRKLFGLSIDKKIINNDKIFFKKYKNIKIQKIDDVLKHSKHILNIGINTMRNNIYIRKCINDFKQYIDIINKIEPFMFFLYTCLEIKEKNFVSDFIKSEQYHFYVNLVYIVNKTERWCNCLKNILKKK